MSPLVGSVTTLYILAGGWLGNLVKLICAVDDRFPIKKIIRKTVFIKWDLLLINIYSVRLPT